jgi:hypothetical protein
MCILSKEWVPQGVYEKLKSLHHMATMDVRMVYANKVTSRILSRSSEPMVKLQIYMNILDSHYLPVRDPLGLTVCFQSPKVVF